MTSKAENNGQKHTFTQKLTTNQNFQTFHLYFLASTGLWDIKGSERYIYSMLSMQPDEGIS